MRRFANAKRECSSAKSRLGSPTATETRGIAFRRSASEGRADYVGFEVGPGWVVGYGMDLDGRMRDLPHLAILR